MIARSSYVECEVLLVALVRGVRHHLPFGEYRRIALETGHQLQLLIDILGRASPAGSETLPGPANGNELYPGSSKVRKDVHTLDFEGVKIGDRDLPDNRRFESMGKQVNQSGDGLWCDSLGFGRRPRSLHLQGRGAGATRGGNSCSPWLPSPCRGRGGERPPSSGERILDGTSLETPYHSLSPTGGQIGTNPSAFFLRR